MHTYCRSNFVVVGCAYADLGGFADDMKSTTSYIFMLIKGTISWKNVKETVDITF